MKQVFQVIPLILFMVSCSVAQTGPSMQWIRIYNGSGNGIDFVNDMMMDRNSDLYFAGRSSGTDGTPDFLILRYSNEGDSTLGIRYSSAGSAWDEVYSIAVDSTDNIYVAGTATFGQPDFYSALVKYSSTGTILWKKDSYPERPLEALIVALDNEENPIVAYSAGTITKYSPLGDSLWSYTVSAESTDLDFIVECLLPDTAGSVYAAISHLFDIGSDVPGINMRLMKLSGNGVLLWEKTLEGDTPRRLRFSRDSKILLETHGDGRVLCFNPDGDSLWDYHSGGLLTGMEVDRENNVVVSGYTGGVGFFDYMTMKISPEGVELWSRTYNSDENLRDFASEVAVDAGNNIYVTGSSHNMISEGVCYTLKYDAGGTLKWDYRLDIPHGIFDNPFGIFLDDSNDVLVGGDYSDSTEMSNLFLMKLKQSPGLGVGDYEDDLPVHFSLLQNYPNPFNPSTRISFTLPSASAVSLRVFNILGEVVATLVNGRTEPGNHTLEWSAGGLPGGVYFCRLVAEEYAGVIKIMLLR